MTSTDRTPRVKRRQAQRARVVRNVIVPAFPEVVKREELCRLCGLIDTAPDLLADIHARWKAGHGVRMLESGTVEMWLARDETPLDHRSFDRHFRKHVDFSDVTTAIGEMLAENFALPPTSDTTSASPLPMPPALHAVALVPAAQGKTKAPTPPTAVPPPMVTLSKPRPEDEEAGASDYFDMENVIRRLRSRMEQVDKDTSFVDTDGRVNSYGIVIWLRLISELRQALEALNRMRNSDRLTKAIIQAHTKRYAQILSAALITRFEKTLAIMRMGVLATAQAEVEKLAREDVKMLMLRAAEESIRESCEVYKLH